jgi:acetoin utilization deacetylase AcuC-like enzyme
MTSYLFSHQACESHEPGPGHPERPARIRAVMERLAAPEFDGLIRLPAPEATVEQLSRMHPRDFVEAFLKALPATGQGRFAVDGDTVASAGTREAALRAAGAVCAAVDAVATGEVKTAFCAVRPPGHHAEPRQPMGFCFFNNVAVGAAHARAAHGFQRVAVIDFDVHHGNGTQAMFERDPGFFFASTHQYPLYPGTGARNERGCGNIVNVPLRAGADSEGFRHAFREVILPALSDFGPDLIMISAGFDAHAEDPLGGMELREADYAYATRELLRVAKSACEGRVVSTLEGGYDLHALAESTAAHVSVLMAGAP